MGGWTDTPSYRVATSRLKQYKELVSSPSPKHFGGECECVWLCTSVCACHPSPSGLFHGCSGEECPFLTIYGRPSACSTRRAGQLRLLYGERREITASARRLATVHWRDTVEPHSKAPTYKAMSAYKGFKQSPQYIFCSTFYFGSKAFSF